MNCTDFYCRVKARERLIAEGKSQTEAKEISEEVFKIVKKVWDKHYGGQKQ
jgi:hypothetical protein